MTSLTKLMKQKVDSIHASVLMQKVKRVIESCETYPQIRVAKTYAVLAVKQIHGEDMWETQEMEEVAYLLEKKINKLLGDDDGKS